MKWGHLAGKDGEKGFRGLDSSGTGASLSIFTGTGRELGVQGWGGGPGWAMPSTVLPHPEPHDESQATSSLGWAAALPSVSHQGAHGPGVSSADAGNPGTSSARWVSSLTITSTH